MRYRHVLRRLARTLGFTLITALTLELGIGANTAMFSFIEGVLLKPLPYPHSDQLIALWHTAPGVNIPEIDMSPSQYFIYREQSRVFQDVGLWGTDNVSFTGHGEPQQIPILNVTDGTLPILGVHPLLGRMFTVADCHDGAPLTIVLTFGFWQRYFSASPAAIGQSILINSRPHRIVGVMPRAFRFLDAKPELIAPLTFDRAKVTLGQFGYQGIARLKPGMTLTDASRDVARLLPVSFAAFPAPPGFSVRMFEQSRMAPLLRTLVADVTGDIGAMLWLILAALGTVLLIACANVANLLLVRAGGRRQELAVRAALGAGRGEIACELMAESLTLGALGGVFGLALAYAGLTVLKALAPAHLPRLDEISIDPPVLLFALALSLAAGVLFGAMPVWKYAGAHIVDDLRGGGRTGNASRERHRARNLLVVGQVALAMILLIAAGLTIRSFYALRAVRPGFTEAGHIQTWRMFIPEAQIKDPLLVARQQKEILDRLAAVPGVESAALTSVIPLDPDGWHDPIYAQDKVYDASSLAPIRRFKFVTPGYLTTLGASLVAGREFSWTDVFDRRPVAMVSENIARELWGSAPQAVGKRIRENRASAWREVIGVVSDMRDDGIDHPAAQCAYWPPLMEHFEGNDGGPWVMRSMAVLVRSVRAGDGSFLSELRKAFWSVNSNLPLADVRTVQAIYEKSMARGAFTLVMLAIAGGMALALGMIGLYGTIAYSVAQRTREIGIRMAMGARQAELAGMFLRHGLALSGIGILCGLAGAIVVTRAMQSLLFEVKPIDPLTFALAPAALIAAAVVASVVPALRVSAVDPLESLRAD